MSERTKAQIGRSSRRKGQVGERALATELKDLLGLDVRRRVRNHAGETDLTGLQGWAAEVKNCAKPELAAWWSQTVDQTAQGEIPVLFYKLPRRPFRAVVPLGLVIGTAAQADIAMTMEMSLEAFAAVYREIEATGLAYEQRIKDSAVLAGAVMQ